MPSDQLIEVAVVRVSGSIPGVLFGSVQPLVAVTTPTGSALGVYDIRQISGRDVEVAYRSIYGGLAVAREVTPLRKPIAVAIPPSVRAGQRRQACALVS